MLVSEMLLISPFYTYTVTPLNTCISNASLPSPSFPSPRAAEILFSMMWAEMEYVGSDIPEISTLLMENLISARHALSLFQHHDGVTGTAKDHVVNDYGAKMLDAINRLHVVQSQAAHYLLTPSKAFYKVEQAQNVFFDLDEERENHFSLPKQTTVQIEHDEDVAKVVVFNSHARRRGELVTIQERREEIQMQEDTGTHNHYPTKILHTFWICPLVNPIS